MISLLEIAQSINEADDDKYVSIGFGRFKLKGKEDDDSADVFVKTDSGDYVKSADQKSDDDGGEKPEQPQGGKLGGSDFDRDANRAADDEADDMDRDARFAADFDGDGDVDDDDDDYETAEEKSEKENSQIGKDLMNMEDDLNGLGIDFLDSALDDGMFAVLGDPEGTGEPDKEMAVNAFPDGDGVGYAVNIGQGHTMIYFDSKEEMLDAAKKLVNDDRIRKSMDKDGKEDLADLGDYAKSILKGKDETINVNLKEKYDRIFRSLK